MHSVPGGYASSVPGGNAKILAVRHKLLEVMVLFQVVVQPLVGIELLWQLKKEKISKKNVWASETI